MKTFPRLAFAAALIAGTGLMVAPADAKKKEEAAKPALKLSPEIQPLALAAQTALAAKDYATATTNIDKILATAKTDDDRYIGQAFQLQAAANQIPSGAANEAQIAPMLDALIANPSTPAVDRARFTFVRAGIAFNQKQYAQALAGYVKARDAGYQDETLSLQITRARVASGDVKGGVAELEASATADRAAGRKVSEEVYRYAISNLQKTDDAVGVQRWTTGWLHDYGTPANWRTAIYVFGFQGAAAQQIDNRQRVDLFRLMRATKALAGQAEYIEYADLTQRIGLASESKAVIDEGHANGLVPAANQNAKELLADDSRQLASEGSTASQVGKATASPTGNLAAGTGDFLLGNGDYATAIQMYRLALQKNQTSPNAARPLNLDEVNTHLGIALALSGDKAGAKTAFAAVTGKPRSDIAGLWITWVDSPPAA